MKKETLKYHISIQDGLKRSLKHFADFVENVLTDKRTWKKYSFKRTMNKSEAKFKIILTKPSDIFHLCNMKGLSCTNMITKDVFINSSRWFNGSKPSKLRLNDYRKYLINHEVFHALGGGHNVCKENQICGVSHQQTLGIPKNSKPNPWPKNFEQKQLEKTPFIFIS